MLHSSSNAPGSGVQCVSLAENGIFFIMKKGSREWLYPPNLSYLTMCSTWGSQSSKRVQGSQQQTDEWCSWVLLMGKMLSMGWCLLGQSSVGSWDKIKPSMEAKKSCSSLWKCRDLLVLAWAGRVETSLHMLGWSQTHSDHPCLEGKAAGTSSQLPGKINHWRHALAWQKSQGRRQNQGKTWYAIGMKEVTEWLQGDMGRTSVGGGILCSTLTAWDGTGKV